MASPFLGEFLGTMILILMGNGVVASVLLKDSKAQNAGWIVITAGWGLAVTSGIFTSIAAGSADAHLNPAVSLGFAIISGDYSKLAIYLPAQLLGAVAGATLVWLHFFPHWAVTEDPSLKLACFSTGPAIRNPLWNLISETIGTFVLMLVVFSIFSKTVTPAGPAPALGPLLVGALVWGIGLSLGGPTGYAINPARDLGPRLAHALLPIAGKGDSDWGYAAVPVIGPMLGAALAALLVNGLHL
ncbi:MAG: MIP/aquaporin family protein [Vulcanimicrobiota bacterium]